MNVPNWLNDTVRGFGRQLGLETLALNDRGAAGVRFDNGAALRLELAGGALTVFVTVGGQPSGEALRALLAEAHPAASGGRRRAVRTACSPRTGEALLAVRIDERDVSVTSLADAFHDLWERAERIGRKIG